MVVLVDEVLPGDELREPGWCESYWLDWAHLEEEDASADSRSDEGPAAHKEVAGVVANHVVEGQSEPPGAE